MQFTFTFSRKPYNIRRQQVLTPPYKPETHSKPLPDKRTAKMNLEQLDHIRAMIARARARDPWSTQLTELLDRRTTHLHTAIKLPPEQASPVLARFVLRYIAHVPDFIEAIADLTREAGIDSEVKPLLNIACGYFVSPPNILAGRSRLATLLDEAYLAHRLLEEVNDRFIAQCGIPLAPMDMTRANIIVHELIGEPFANELDQAVLFSAELLLDQHRFEGKNFRRYVALHKQRGWSEELNRWPCLAENLDIDVRFGGNHS